MRVHDDLRQMSGVRYENDHQKPIYERKEIVQARYGPVLALNNDTALEALFEDLDLSMNEDEVKTRQICCFDHILNLIAKTVLSGFDTDSFVDEVDVGNAEADF